MDEKEDSSRPSQRVRFGVFEVDFARRELRKHGLNIKLQDKPFRILLALLERPGEAVSREELREKLWAPDTYVDFERSLNIAINKLRAALGDESQSPRFIETLPRRGYKFIAPVVPARADARPDSSSPILINSGAAGAELHAEANRPAWGLAHRRGQRWKNVLGVGAAVLVLGSAAAWRFWPDPAPQVLEFVQLTSDGEEKGGPLYSDGVNLFFTSGRTLNPMQVSTKGGQAVPLRPDLGFVGVQDYSAKRAALLVSEGGKTTNEMPLWEVPLPGGSPRPLGGLKAYSAAWSPDGERIALGAGHKLKVAQNDGSALRELGSFPGRILYVRWSPDGRRLGFVVLDEKTNSASLWDAADDGSHARQLLSGSGGAETQLRGNWMPGGRDFLLSLSRDGRSDLWLLRAQNGWFGAPGTRMTRLTSGPIDMVSPLPSEDGRRLYAVGKHDRNELVRYDAKSRHFLPYLQGLSADGLSFSRDAKWVTYVLWPERTLWRSRVDSTERAQLTFSPLEALLPVWAPDGKTIAFMGHAPGRPWKIYSVPAAGGTPEPILRGESNQGHPGWSPDGRAMIFAGVPWMQAFAPGSTAIYRVDLPSRNVKTLHGSENLWSPRWSPDGRYIVAESLDSHRLLVYEMAAGRWTPLAELAKDSVAYASWSHDSQWVYFNTLSEAEHVIFRAAVRSRRVERVYNLSDVRQPSTLGKWFTLAPDDVPLLLRSTSLEEIYVLTLSPH